jgi:hypothetical protein
MPKMPILKEAVRQSQGASGGSYALMWGHKKILGILEHFRHYRHFISGFGSGRASCVRARG